MTIDYNNVGNVVNKFCTSLILSVALHVGGCLRKSDQEIYLHDFFYSSFLIKVLGKFLTLNSTYLSGENVLVLHAISAYC